MKMCWGNYHWCLRSCHAVRETMDVRQEARYIYWLESGVGGTIPGVLIRLDDDFLFPGYIPFQYLLRQERFQNEILKSIYCS